MCFLIYFHFGWSVHFWKWSVKVPYYDCVTADFPLLCLLAFALCIEVLPCWVHKYLQLLYLLLVLIPWSLCSALDVSCNSLYFKVYFVWYENCCSSFLLISICMDPLTFSLYVSLGLKWVSIYACIWVLFLYPFSQSVLLVEAFNPFTFKVIINIYVPITIFLIVLGLLL